METLDCSRSEALQVADFVRLLAGRRVPRSVSVFYMRAVTLAIRLRDRRALRGSTRAHEVTRLLRLADGRRVVVEIGTAVGWTAGALALAHPGRRVISIDPFVRPQRERYLSLLGDARARVELVEARGEEGPAALGLGETPPVELLYIDGRHTCEATVAAFEAWRPALAPRAVVAFHDYGEPGFPGVAEAVARLGLEGEVDGTLFATSV